MRLLQTPTFQRRVRVGSRSLHPNMEERVGGASPRASALKLSRPRCACRLGAGGNDAHACVLRESGSGTFHRLCPGRGRAGRAGARPPLSGAARSHSLHTLRGGRFARYSTHAGLARVRPHGSRARNRRVRRCSTSGRKREPCCVSPERSGPPSRGASPPSFNLKAREGGASRQQRMSAVSVLFDGRT